MVGARVDQMVDAKVDVRVAYLVQQLVGLLAESMELKSACNLDIPSADT